MSVDLLDAGLRPGTRAGRGWLAPILVFAVSGLLYLINLDRAPHPDELYHILAARGLLEHGEPRIADGLYTRVILYTQLVSALFAGFGESLQIARLPSVLAMAMLGALLFVWLRKEGGSRAAWLGAGLFAISPFAVETAQFARFYALQSLSFFLGIWALYSAFSAGAAALRTRIALGLAALTCLAFATYLQVTTLLGIAGLGVWLLLVIGVPWLADPKVSRSLKRQSCIIAALLAGVVVIALLATDLGRILWATYRSVPLFNLERANDFWFYHLFNLLYYPSLWPLIGLLALVALNACPRPALLALLIYAVGFCLNSFAGPKNLRYVAYAQPFLFMLFGLGLASLWPQVMRLVDGCRNGIGRHLAAVVPAGRYIVDVLIWGAVVFALLANSAFLRTATLLADITVPPEKPSIRWAEAESSLKPYLDRVEIVVTMAELETLYFWDRYDILLSPSRLSEMEEKHEFARDHRTGRPVISTADSLRRILECTASGVFVSNTHRWQRVNFMDAATTSLIEQEMARIDLPQAPQLIAYAWDNGDREVLESDDPACADLKGMIRGRLE